MRTCPKTDLSILHAAIQRQGGEIMTSVSAGHIIFFRENEMQDTYSSLILDFMNKRIKCIMKSEF